MSIIMSFELSTAYRRFLEHFYGRFPEDNIWYLVYPFFKVFKYCGFAPVKLCLDKFPHVRFHPDRKSIFLSVGSFFGVLVGFSYGVYELSLYETLGFHKTATVISFIASWVQIFSLFLLGCTAMVTSWINLAKMRNFIAKVSNIDYALEMTGAVISYRVYRKRLLIQAVIAFIIPSVLSMVNCVMIKSPFTLSASCYWFICFAPMLSLTLKEIKFYNLMFLLKGKFNLINQQIKKIGESKLLHSGSISVFHKSSDSVVLVRKDAKLTEQIRALADIYSNVVDCVDLVMELFSLHILMTTCISFAVVTIQSYNLFALIVRSLTMEIHEIVFTVLWIVIQILMIGVNVVACNLTADAVSDM